MLARVFPFPHIPKSPQCSFLSPTVLSPQFFQDHLNLQFHCTLLLSMVSGFPHSPLMVLGLFIALVFLPWFQSFLIHQPCSQGSPALPYFLYGLRATQHFSHCDRTTVSTLPRQDPAQSPGQAMKAEEKAAQELSMLREGTGCKSVSVPKKDWLKTSVCHPPALKRCK